MSKALLKQFHDYAKTHKDQIRELARNGQAPSNYVIGCIDTRAVPAIILQPGLGELFSHHAMGAIVRPYRKGTVLASGLEYATKEFGINEIILMGHSGCGAMNALINKTKLKEVGSFVRVAGRALKTAQAMYLSANDNKSLLQLTTEQTLHLSAANLRTYPSIQDLGDTVSIKQWMFDMNEPTIYEYDLPLDKWNDTLELAA